MADVLAREKQLRKVESFVNKAESQLNSILEMLNWTKERTLQKASYVTCPLDSGHKMPASSLEEHLELCSWLKDGYTRSEKEEALPSSHFFYKNSTSVVPVLIDRDIQHKILTEAALKGGVLAEARRQVKDVPRTMERCFAELSPAERFAVYDYVVERARATNKTASIKLEDLQVDFEKKQGADSDRPPSQLEIKSKMRDYKRRRQSYRGKNVHITRKSYTEVLKEVIENQTEYLKQLVAGSEDGDGSAARAESRCRSKSFSPARERPSSEHEQEHHARKRKRSPSPVSHRHEKEEERSNGHRSRKREHKKKSHKRHKKHKHRKQSDSDDS